MSEHNLENPVAEKAQVKSPFDVMSLAGNFRSLMHAGVDTQLPDVALGTAALRTGFLTGGDNSAISSDLAMFKSAPMSQAYDNIVKNLP